MNTGNTYCQDLLRRYDRDRYLSALFAPKELRDDLFALYAFNLEIAGTRESVSEALIGQMRLKWWFDVLDGIFDGNPPAHQVAAPLSVAVRRGGIERQHLENLIEIRTHDLTDTPPETLSDLLEYADGTSGALVRSALGILGEDSQRFDDCAYGVGIAWAMIGIIRALPLNLAQGRCQLPNDLCLEAGLDMSTLYEGSAEKVASDELKTVIRGLCGCAHEYLAKARSGQSGVPRKYLSALLPAVLADYYLKELASYDYDPFQLPLARSGPGVSGMLRLLWAALRGRI